MSSSVLGIITPHPPIMVPEVGGERASVTRRSADAMRRASDILTSFAPQTLVLMSPHAPAAYDAFLVSTGAALRGDLGRFGAPEAAFSAAGDPALAETILALAGEAGIPAVAREALRGAEPGALDHGSMVPLSFLDPESHYPLVVLSLSGLPLADHRAFGMVVSRAAAAVGRRVAFVASGDCSHRLTREAPAGYSSRGAEFDALLARLISEGDFEALERIEPALVEAAGECGLRSFVTLGGFVSGIPVATRVLAYEGPWGVGYLTALVGDAAELVAVDASGEGAVDIPESGAKSGTAGGGAGADPDREVHESAPVALARRTIEVFVRERRMIGSGAQIGLPEGRYGVFVSLHRGGDLRGCIGTIAPTQPTLAEEIVHNAVQAATADPRFDPLRPDELDDLEVSVDVLQPPEPASFDDLDPKRWGVIVSADWRRGLLLPDLEGVDTPEQQLSIAMRKAGIAPGESVRLERFRVDRYR